MLRNPGGNPEIRTCEYNLLYILLLSVVYFCFSMASAAAGERGREGVAVVTGWHHAMIKYRRFTYRVGDSRN